MIGTYVNPVVREAQLQQVIAQPAPDVKQMQHAEYIASERQKVNHSPPPLGTELSGKPVYVNFEGQKIGSVINTTV